MLAASVASPDRDIPCTRAGFSQAPCRSRTTDRQALLFMRCAERHLPRSARI